MLIILQYSINMVAMKICPPQTSLHLPRFDVTADIYFIIIYYINTIEEGNGIKFKKGIPYIP